MGTFDLIYLVVLLFTVILSIWFIWAIFFCDGTHSFFPFARRKYWNYYMDISQEFFPIHLYNHVDGNYKWIGRVYGITETNKMKQVFKTKPCDNYERCRELTESVYLHLKNKKHEI